MVSRLAGAARRTSPPAATYTLRNVRPARVNWISTLFGMVIPLRLQIPADSPRTQDEAAQGILRPEQEQMWESAAPVHSAFYGWIACESSAVKALRQYLIHSCGLQCEPLSLMAYWCHGVDPDVGA